MTAVTAQALAADGINLDDVDDFGIIEGNEAFTDEAAAEARRDQLLAMQQDCLAAFDECVSQQRKKEGKAKRG